MRGFGFSASSFLGFRVFWVSSGVGLAVLGLGSRVFVGLGLRVLGFGFLGFHSLGSA